MRWIVWIFLVNTLFQSYGDNIIKVLQKNTYTMLSKYQNIKIRTHARTSSGHKKRIYKHKLCT